MIFSQPPPPPFSFFIVIWGNPFPSPSDIILQWPPNYYICIWHYFCNFKQFCTKTLKFNKILVMYTFTQKILEHKIKQNKVSDAFKIDKLILTRKELIINHKISLALWSMKYWRNSVTKVQTTNVRHDPTSGRKKLHQNIIAVGSNRSDHYKK